MLKRILLLILILGCTTELEGPYKVYYVIDGDTIAIDNFKIRLSGIDAPEKDECYYKEAKEEVTKLLANQTIYLERDKTNIDKYNRLLRYVYLDGANINSHLVQEGFAKVYDKYKDDTKRYEELKAKESIAVQNKLGVWGCTS